MSQTKALIISLGVFLFETRENYIFHKCCPLPHAMYLSSGLNFIEKIFVFASPKGVEKN